MTYPHRKITLLFSILVLVSGSVYAAKDTETTTFKNGTREVAQLKDKYGVMTENVPCPCIFDKGRYFYKQEVNLLGYVWGCREYDSQEVCLDIVRHPRED